MKAAGKFLSAASAVALSAGLVVPAAVAVQFAFVNFAHAAVVSRIEVQGNQRVDAETIRGYLDITPGKSFSNADIDEAVKRLFATGLFSDVRINQVGLDAGRPGRRIFGRQPGPFPGQQEAQGRRSLPPPCSCKPRGAVLAGRCSMPTSRRSSEAYNRIGRDDTQVTTQIMDLGENRVNVVFEINEGGRTKIAVSQLQRQQRLSAIAAFAI